MRFKVFIVSVFFIWNLLPVISLAQNKVVVIPLVESQPLSEFYPSFLGDRQIRDQDTIYLSINVPYPAGLIKKLEVVMFIEHECSADLEVKLWHEESDKLATLFNSIDDCNTVLFVTLDDNAKTDINDDPSFKSFIGRYSTGGSLDYFKGTHAAGHWRLSIRDKNENDTGTIYSWGLYITY